MSLGELPYKTTYFWRVIGSDGAKESVYSNTLQFKTADAPAAPAPGLAAAVFPVACRPVLAAAAGRAVGRCRVTAPSVVQRSGARESRRAPELVSGSGGSWQFMDQVVDTLRTYDTRWGYNGKRGNANDPSKDVVTYQLRRRARTRTRPRSTSSTSSAGTAARRRHRSGTT